MTGFAVRRVDRRRGERDPRTAAPGVTTDTVLASGVAPTEVR